MDFLKACNTNIYAGQDFLETTFHVLKQNEQPTSDQGVWSSTKRALTALRSGAILCASVDGEIWCFGATGSDDGSDLEGLIPEFRVKEQGVIKDALFRSSGQGKRISNALLESIEQNLAYRLSKETGWIHVQPWVWTYRNDDNEGWITEHFLVRLNPKLWPDNSLYLTTDILPVRGLNTSIVSPDFDAEVVVSPLGKVAKCLPHAKTLSSASDSWRSCVSQMLAAEGVDIAENAVWIDVQLVDEANTHFAWPSSLCLPWTPSTTHSRSTSSSQTWKDWFGTQAQESRFRTPLAAAEEWLLSAAERERSGPEGHEAGVSTHQNGEIAMMSSLAIEVPGSDVESSPPFMQRVAEQQAALSGIYPTPPDGLAHLSNSIPISSESGLTGSQLEQIQSGGDIILGDGPSYRESRLDSLTEQGAYQHESEDLFGDGGEMEFGENEVGDADFSFFDEPDDGPGDEGAQNRPPGPNDNEATDHPTEREVIDILKGEEEFNFNAAIVTDTAQIADNTDGTSAGESQTSNSSPKPVSNQSEAQNAEETEILKKETPSEKPLSPFGIKERLLPPPVPASFAQKTSKGEFRSRSDSTFGPVTFREGLSFSAKYGNIDFDQDMHSITDGGLAPSISLPPTRKKPRQARPIDDDSSSDEDNGDESEEDSYETSSFSEPEENMPPQLPWDTRKRKRDNGQDHIRPWAGPSVELSSDKQDHQSTRTSYSEHNILATLDKWSRFQMDADGAENRLNNVDSGWTSQLHHATMPKSSQWLPGSIEAVHKLTKQDIAFVAQIVAEQAATCLADSEPSVTSWSANEAVEYKVAPDGGLLDPVKEAIQALQPSLENIDLAKASLTRETPSRAITNSNMNNQPKGQHGQPRPVQRDGTVSNPEYFALPPPYVKIKRGSDDWEMLPPCLSFWDILGLGPAGGSKDVRAFCIFPSNQDLQESCERFLTELGLAYEGSKLGSHVHHRTGRVGRTDPYTNGMVAVDLTEDDSLEGAFRSYASASTELGGSLASLIGQEPGRTTVIYMLNPFSGRAASHHLCASFWLLFKAYRENLPKARRAQCGNDILLQIIPMEFVASSDGLMIQDGRQLATLAREVYDRCPPPAVKVADTVSVLPVLASPSVEIAGQSSRRVMFQLTADPPNDLMHENSYMHVGYSRSKDQQWLSVAWSDNTGQYQANAAYCVRGRSFADAAEEAWGRTLDILAARQVTWRVYIVTDDRLDSSLVQCWLSLCSKPRAQALCVTLLSLQQDPILALTPPSPNPTDVQPNAADAGIFTPASTPSAANAISSPDVNSQTPAPPTPAASEGVAAIAENDPDAHLVDLADETWAMLLSPKLLMMSSSNVLASGVVFRRGEPEPTPGAKLPSLGYSVHWTIQVKPSGSVDEGQAKYAELTLRDAMKAYRNLSVLTNVRKLAVRQFLLLPIHMAVAKCGADGLEGLLP